MRQAFFCMSFMLLGATTACSHHIVVVPEPNPTGLRIQESKTATIFKGGAYQTVVDCDTNIIDEIVVKQSFDQGLVSFLSLGTVWPLTIEYRCGKIATELGSTTD